MREDELRNELNEIAARAPRGAAGTKSNVLQRGRQLLRRRRAAQIGSALAAVVVVGGGVALWWAGSGSHPRTVVSDVPTTAVPTTVPATTVAPTTVAPTTVAPSVVTPTTGATPTTVAAAGRDLVPADPGFTFTSTPVVAGGAVFAIETKLSGATAVDARVARIDLGSLRIAARSDQPGAAAVVVAGNRLWVGVGAGSGSGGPFNVPAITRVVSLDLGTLAPLGAVTLPAPGSEGLTTTAGAVWALSGTNVVRIDAATGRIAATIRLAIPASNPFRTLAVSADGTRLYVGWATARQVEGVGAFDEATAQLLHQNANVGSGPSNVGPDLVYAGAEVWATFPTGSLGQAVALRASDLRAAGPVISGPNSMAIAPAGTVMWVSRSATLDCVSLGDNTLISHPVASGVNLAPAPVPGTVYATTGAGLAVITTAGACGS